MKREGVTRRQFIKSTSSGALGLAAWMALNSRVAAQELTLRIVQWNHFVPAYDEWFNKVFTPRWGQKNGVKVVVENVSYAELPAIGASEASRVAAGQDPGHDLVQFNSPPASFEPQVIDHAEIIQEAQKKVGKYIPLAELSTHNPVTGKYFGFSDNFVPDPVHYRSDVWQKAAAELSGFDRVSSSGPDTWDDIRRAGRVMKAMGNPVGLGLSQEIDTNMFLRALMYSWGTAVQDPESNVIIDTPPFRERTLDALKFVRALYKETMTDEIFTWTAASNNQGMLSGRLSLALNAISITRTAQKVNPDLSKNIEISYAPAGPVARRGLEHVMGVYVIWNTKNKAVIDKAKQFLIDLVMSYDPEKANANDWGPGKFLASEFYDYPTFEQAISKEKRLSYLKNDEGSKKVGDRPDKLLLIETAFDWALNVGWPGYSNAAVDEVFNTFILPTMFARVAKDEAKPEEALEAAAGEIRRVYKKWREQGLVGGKA